MFFKQVKNRCYVEQKGTGFGGENKSEKLKKRREYIQIGRGLPILF